MEHLLNKDAIKSQHIYNDLKTGILNGRFEGKIQGERELSREYDVNVKTVNKAVSKLVEEGLLIRKKGLGTFVRSHLQHLSSKIVALIIERSGHVYEEYANSIQRELKALNFIPVTLTFSEFKSSDLFMKHLNDIQPCAIIVQCNQESLLASAILELRNITPMVFFQNLIIETEIPNSYKSVFEIDHQKGGYLATKYLIEQGHKNILHLTKYKVAQTVGYEQAMTENGLKDRIQVLHYDHPSFRRGNIEEISDEVLKIFKSSNKPTAVFATQDILITGLLRDLKPLKLSVPEELSLVGYYNTPWSKLGQTEFSSMSIREDEIAKKITKQIVDKKIIQESESISPEIILRNSISRILV